MYARSSIPYISALTDQAILQANIFVTEEYAIQIADLGLSAFGDSTSTSIGSRECGAVRWLAPEILSGSKHTRMSDIYAYGCVWIEVS